MDTSSLYRASRVQMAWMFVAWVAIASTPAVASSGGFNRTGSMNVARLGQTATLLGNGEVLATGGMNFTTGFLASSEVYNPATGKWTLEGNLSIARFDHSAVLLNNGKVLVPEGWIQMRAVEPRRSQAPSFSIPRPANGRSPEA